MRILLEITAKLETLRLDGETQYGVQGRLQVELPDIDSDTEPLNLGIRLSPDVWEAVRPGDVLAFDLNPTIVRPSAFADN